MNACKRELPGKRLRGGASREAYGTDWRKVGASRCPGREGDGRRSKDGIRLTDIRATILEESIAVVAALTGAEGAISATSLGTIGVTQGSGSIGVALSVIAFLAEIDCTVPTGVGEITASAEITAVRECGIVETWLADFIEGALEDAVTAGASLEEAARSAAIAITGIEVITFLPGLQNAIATEESGGSAGIGGSLTGAIAAEGTLRALGIGDTEGRDLTLTVHALGTQRTLGIGLAGNGDGAGSVDSFAATALGIGSALLFFEDARGSAAITRLDVPVIALLRRFEETVAAERSAENFTFRQAGGRAAVAIAAIAVIAAFAGINGRVAARGTGAVGGGVAGIGTGAGNGNAGIILTCPVGNGAAAEEWIAGVGTLSEKGKTSVFVTRSVGDDAAAKGGITEIISFSKHEDTRASLTDEAQTVFRRGTGEGCRGDRGGRSRARLSRRYAGIGAGTGDENAGIDLAFGVGATGDLVGAIVGSDVGERDALVLGGALGVGLLDAIAAAEDGITLVLPCSGNRDTGAVGGVADGVGDGRGSAGRP